MQTEIFSRDADPDIDAPLFHANKKRKNMLLDTGAIRMIDRHRAQFTCEHRDARTIPEAKDYANYAAIDSNARWRIVNQTKPGGAPGNPAYQLVRA